MADEKISQLADGTSLQAADLLVIARSGGNYKLTGTELAASFDAAGAAAAAQAASQPLDADLTAIAGLDSSASGAIASDGAGWIKKTYAQVKTALGLVKADVGLGSVDNTADSAKPVSTAQQTALDLKANLASPTFTGTVTVPTPTNDTDASTKAYVDAVAQGLSPKASVRVATAAALPTNTYLAGVITITATGTLTVDGKVTALNDRVLVKDEAAQANNGIYLCTTAGAVGIQGVLTRATDSNTGAKILGGFVFVEDGTVNAAAGFVNTNTSAPTLGTTAITYTQFSGAGEITAGAGLTKTGNTLDVVGTANRIVVSADAVDVGTNVYVAGGTDVAIADGGTGSSTAATAAAALAVLPLAGGALTGALAMGANKITGLANGTVATDAAAFGQLPTITTTRSVFVGAAANGSFSDGGILATLGTAPDSIGVAQLADGSTQGFFTVAFALPKDAVAGQPLNIRIAWGPGSTDASSHTVQWSVDARGFVAGTSVISAGTTTTWTGDSAARTANLMVLESSKQIISAGTADNIYRINIRRIGADANDTYVGAVNVIGFFVDYTAVA